MNKFIQGLCAALVCALAFTISAQAAPVSYGDNYIGGDPTNSSYDGDDVIGSNSLYNTTGAEVERVGDNLRVRIESEYADNVGSHDTSLGALFIGDDTVAMQLLLNGVTDTTDDTFVSNESRFQYALDFNGNRPATSDENTFEQGSANLYSLAGIDQGEAGYVADVDPSAAPGYIYRGEQALRPNSNAGAPIGSGSWTLSGANKYVEFVIDDFFATSGSPIDSGTQNGFVFYWAMSCANDVIFEYVLPGSLNIDPIPLPASFILLLSGLLGVGWLGRARAKQA